MPFFLTRPSAFFRAAAVCVAAGSWLTACAWLEDGLSAFCFDCGPEAEGGADSRSPEDLADTIEAEQEQEPGRNPPVCAADAFQDRIGGPLIGSTAPEPDGGVFLRASDLPRPYRILPPNALMTMDFNPARLNVFLDQRMHVVRIVCG